MRVYIKHHAMDGSFGRSIVDMECKSVSGVHVYFRKNKVLPHPWYKQFSVFNLPPGNCLFTLRYGAISGHSTGICCWQFGHSTGAVVRLALVITSLCCWTHAWHISLQCGHFVHEPIEWWQKWLQKGSYWYPQNRSCYLLDHYTLLWWLSPYGEHSCGMEISPHSVPIQQSLFTYILPRSSCHQFSSFVSSKSLTIKPNH